jgi:hypothetical protein
MNFAIWRISASLSLRKPLQSTTDAIVFAQLPAERRRHEMLQGLQAFAAAADERTAVLALEVDPRRFRRLFDRGPELNAHRVDHALDKRRDLSRQSLVHAALLSIRCSRSVRR